MEDSGIVGCNNVLLSKWFPMSQRNALHSSSSVWSIGLTPLNVMGSHYLQTSENTHPAMQCHIP